MRIKTVIPAILVSAAAVSATTYVRANQLGYLASGSKVGLVLATSTKDIPTGTKFSILPEKSTTPVFTGTIGVNRWGTGKPFTGVYSCDFSSFTTKGTYVLSVGTVKSEVFTIGDVKPWQSAMADVQNFYLNQRCGVDGCDLHKKCHTNDVAPGGWHDAGDYIKYMITTGFTAIQFLTAIEYANDFKFSDGLLDSLPKDGIPDLLAEAKVGLDWIMLATKGGDPTKFVYQIGDQNDHDVGDRLPEDDTNDKRVTLRGWGGNHLGKAVASLAMGARQFKTINPTYSATLLQRAKELFAQVGSYESKVLVDPDKFYPESSTYDDLALAASEMFRTTGDASYKTAATKYIAKITDFYGLGWDDGSFLAGASCYRAGIDTLRIHEGLSKCMTDVYNTMNTDAFFVGSGYSWGTTPMVVGDAQKGIMYSCLTGDKMGLAITQNHLDYLMGRNNWGTTFIQGVGAVYPKNTASQLNSLSGKLNRGAVVGGPAPVNEWKGGFEKNNIPKVNLTGPLQGDLVYFDIEEDYVSNEVAIDYAAATAFALPWIINAYKHDSPNPINEDNLAKQAASSFTAHFVGNQIVVNSSVVISTVDLVAMNGKVVAHFELPAGKITNLTAPVGLANGVYTLIARGSEVSVARKIVYAN